MAWMFAGTEQDLCLGIHFHMHGPVIPPPPPAGPLPTAPSIHPAIGPIRDKLASTVTVDGRKAAKTGSIAKILLPPHLPVCYIAYWGVGPMLAGPKDGTGIDQILFGAGIGAHPIGGIMFVVIEGKPAAGFLSQSLSCINFGPVDLMLPGMPNLLLIPTRGPSVFYGIAPLAIDLCVLLVAMVQNLMNFLVSLVPEGLLRDLASNLADGVVAGVEKFCEARFERDPPASTSEALAEAGRTAAYTFVEGATETLAEAASGAIGDFVAGPEGSPTRMLWDAVVADPLQEGMEDMAHGAINDLTGGDYQEWRDQRDAEDAADDATAPDPLGQITRPMESFGETANEVAGIAGGFMGAANAESPEAAQEAMDSAMEDLNGAVHEHAVEGLQSVLGTGEEESEPEVQTTPHDQTEAPERPELTDPGTLDFGGGGASEPGGVGEAPRPQQGGGTVPGSPEETSRQSQQALDEQAQHDAEQPAEVIDFSDEPLVITARPQGQQQH